MDDTEVSSLKGSKITAMEIWDRLCFRLGYHILEVSQDISIEGYHGKDESEHDLRT